MSDLPLLANESHTVIVRPSEVQVVAVNESALAGYRLHRLEVFNWGTFDGAVHSMMLDGQTSLLVGQNGAGKSTLVDALLTLLVRPGKTRNYNLAAGAKQTERSEKSYIQGAFDRRSQEDTNRGEVQFLRGPGTYSVLLACFRNGPANRAFTLAQVLYVSDGGVEKVYCFASDERTIARDISGLKGMDKLSQEMKRRGFRATTKYTEYFEWFRKATGLKDQAMDMFNQTVAVKDIQRLNDFIRKHMLEAKPWSEKVDELFKHFKDLSDAHRELERVRQQRDLLLPIEKYGTEYRTLAGELEQMERLLAAADSYFPKKIIELFEPELSRRRDELGEVKKNQERLKVEINAEQEECRGLKNEIDQAGGERMRDIPRLIENHKTQAESKRAECGRLLRALNAAGIGDTASDAPGFDTMRAKLAPLRIELEENVVQSEQQRTTLIESRVDPSRELRATEAELELLKKRQGNLPPEYVEMRRQLCEDLRLSERDLPFAAEMIAVKAAESAWEGSIEMALRPFALSLLVPHRHYLVVSRTIDRRVLRDSRGHGQRLVYLEVGERERKVDGPRPPSQSLFWKVEFREGWSPLLPWVKAELQERYNIRCCETIEEFQQAHERSMTQHRHLKHNSSRHEKDDRDRVADPRHFVLGWDNREKQRRLAETIESLKEKLNGIDSQISRLEQAANKMRQRIRSVEEAERVKSFHEIDFASHERQIAELCLELKAIEENSDTIQLLKQSLAAHEESVTALQQLHYQAVKREQALETEIAEGQRLVNTQTRTLAANREDGSFDGHAACFVELDRILGDDPITLDNIGQLPEVFRRKQRQKVEELRNDLEPLKDNVVKAMGKFLNVNPEERGDLEMSLQYLPDFLKLLERIQAEDLPRFEERFKQRLNEKVGQEIGVLRGNLNTERSEIEERIQLLNLSLRQVPFGNGSHMKLVAKQVRDPEIGLFRKELDACVSGQFEGTLAADEARYIQIESLIMKLRDEERWRMKVVDVRNWFDFAAVETDDVSGEERSYHDDSAGQSGGEKAKLAFTILIAAIAFQYDLDPACANSNRFHFVVVDEMFSRVDDSNSSYALELFRKFGLQLLIVAPLDAKARVTEDFVGCYFLVSKDEKSNRSQVLPMTAREFSEQNSNGEKAVHKSR
jgi:uncharacterized protein YPO0396